MIPFRLLTAALIGVASRRILVAAAIAGAFGLPATSAFARELPNYDALARAADAADVSPAARALPKAATGGALAPGLGVPKFLSAREARAALAASGAPLARRAEVTDGAERARGYLRDVAAVYRISAAEVAALAVSHAAEVPGGGSLARFRTDVDGIEVWREEATVLLDARGELVAIGGYVTGTPAGVRTLPSIDTRATAIGVALAEQGFDRAVTANLVPMREEGGYQWLTLPDGTMAEGNVMLAAPVRTKRVWYRLPDKLVPAWYVEVQVKDPASSRELDAYSYVISATDGAVLFRNSLVSNVAFSYRVFAESTAPYLPLPGPGGRGGFPHPTGQPDGYQPPFQPRNLVTLQSAPFSRNDPWLADLANRTTGNNVEAFTNIAGSDGFGPPGTDECNLSLPVDGDLHACVTGAQTFDHPYDPNAMPNANRMQVNSVVTNLFYTINWLHDWFYDAGFDETARNAQTNNFNRGGAANDSIFAEAQDYNGTNNASMFTPPDGQRPRMRMHLWTSSLSLGKVVAPATIAGVKTTNTATFGAQSFDLTGQLVLAQDAADPTGPSTTDGCTALTNAAAVAGHIAVIDRGTCLFVDKAKTAQDAGAAAVLIVNNVSPGAPGMSGDDATITIPVLSISLDDGDAIKAALPQGVVMRLARQSALPRDGAFDNTVVAHEWGHYLSNRLVGNANGLVAKQASGMGEGWSDFVSMLLFVKEEDRHAGGATNFGGTYPITPYPDGGPDFAPDVLNNAYYYGLRRYPYTRDMGKNPLTFRHIANDQPLPATPPVSPRGSSAENAEVHNTGEVWAAMLWECYSNLLNDSSRFTFAQTQERMKRYLVTSLKLTPVDPTFVNARDALLAAMQAQDAQDHDLCLAGFAKRGLGVGAVAPNNLSETNIGVVESFRVTADPGVVALAIEYHHAAFDHYFVTSLPEEIVKLDNGTFQGWARTGESFAVYSDAPPGALPVCRFFSTAFGDKSSHFYAPSAAECTIVKFDPSWQIESESVFTMPPPDDAGNCAAGMPVYRLYNDGQGDAPNHRYTTSLATRATMLAQGWIAEGSGVGVVMCTP